MPLTTTRLSPLRRLTERLHRDGGPVEDASGRAGVSASRGDSNGNWNDSPDDDPTVTAIKDVAPRQRVTVVGEVRSVSLRPRVDVPTLEVELWDGTKALHLVWLGRRSIIGIVPGIRVRATGRVTEQRRALTIFNPAYEIVGQARESHG